MTEKAKQPKGLYILAFAELWDRYSYYGIQALLVLYLTKVFLFSDSQAYVLYGAYTALTFATPVIGGILADRLIGFHRAIILGAILIVIANIILMVPGADALYLGLGIMICGIGLFKPNNTSLLGTFYQKEDIRRNGGFTIFYIGMNAGALLGPVAYGFIAMRYGWHLSFLTSSFGMLISIGLFVLNRDKLQPENFSRRVNWLVYFGIFIASGLFALLVHYPEILGNLLYAVGAVTLISLAIIAFRSASLERNHIFAIMILSFFCIFFFAFSLQTATSLTLFIERNINRNLLGWQIPTMMFLSVSAFFIIIIAPLVARCWVWLAQHKLEPSSPLKVALGLAFAGISFAIFSFAAQGTAVDHKGSMIGIMVGNFFIGLGELCILPVVMSAITELAPIKLRGTLMGVLFLALAFSGYFAGIIAKILNTASDAASQNGTEYAHGFMQICYFAIGTSIIMLGLTPILKRLMSNNIKQVVPETLVHPLQNPESARNFRD